MEFRWLFRLLFFALTRCDAVYSVSVTCQTNQRMWMCNWMRAVSGWQSILVTERVYQMCHDLVSPSLFIQLIFGADQPWLLLIYVLSIFPAAASSSSFSSSSSFVLESFHMISHWSRVSHVEQTLLIHQHHQIYLFVFINVFRCAQAVRSTAASVPSAKQCTGFDFLLHAFLSRSFTVTVCYNHNSKLYLYLDILFVAPAPLKIHLAAATNKSGKIMRMFWCKNALIRCDGIHANNKWTFVLHLPRLISWLFRDFEVIWAIIPFALFFFRSSFNRTGFHEHHANRCRCMEVRKKWQSKGQTLQSVNRAQRLQSLVLMNTLSMVGTTSTAELLVLRFFFWWVFRFWWNSSHDFVDNVFMILLSTICRLERWRVRSNFSADSERRMN